MKLRTIIIHAAFCFIFSFMCGSSFAHDIYFCGEKIPLDDKLVVEKLMNIIRKQINYVNVPSLRLRVKQFMPQVERWLESTNLPKDFKYLPIVESGFNTTVSSGAGAKGFWQLMPLTAQDKNLTVNELVDDRTDFDKSTLAACKLLIDYYTSIKKRFGISSWVLTAAAYNVGIGNISKAITKQGKNYFSMNLNPETAAYVYKIIAVKELFEFPELYMENLGYNVFNTAPSSDTKKKIDNGGTDISLFSSMKVNVNTADGEHPRDLKRDKIRKARIADPSITETYVSAKIKGKYKDFKDGSVINIVLENDLLVGTTFIGANNLIQGTAWIIDGRLMVDLGYGHQVTVLDSNKEKGIPLDKLKNKEFVILKVLSKS